MIKNKNASTTSSSSNANSNSRSSQSSYVAPSTPLSFKEKMFHGLNVWAVVLYLGFFVTFFMRLSLAYHFWLYTVVAALFTYFISLSNSLERHIPTSFNIQGILGFLSFVSISPDFRYSLYCWILMQTEHISLVAVTPLAVYSLFSSIQIFQSFTLFASERYPKIRPFCNWINHQLVVKRDTLLYGAAVAEILTFFILFWRYISGTNKYVGLLVLVLLGQFIMMRYNTSDQTRQIINEVHRVIQKYIPNIPNIPSNARQ